MKRWALIVNNTVNNVVEQDDQPQIEGLWVSLEGTNGGMGMVYKEDGTFDFSEQQKEMFRVREQEIQAQLEKQSAPPKRFITVPAFKDRLGINALAIFASTNPVCVAFKEMFYDRTRVDLDSPQIRGYLMMLVENKMPAASKVFPGSGPMTEEMVNKILSAEIQPEEV